MAFLDASLNFSTAQAITATAASTSLYDITSAGSGNAPAMVGPNSLLNNIGGDIFAGDGQAIPTVQLNVTTAGTGTGTVTIQIQSAPDNGSYAPGTWTTVGSTGPLVGTSLTAASVIFITGAPLPPGAALPRFYRLNYVVASTFTASFTANLTINPGTVRNATLYGSNFTVVGP